MAVRDPLDWSLPLVWHLCRSRGNTPMISRRLVDFGEHATGKIRFDLEGDSHIVTGRRRSPKICRHCPTCRSARRSSIATATRCRGPGWWAGRSTPMTSSQAIAALERLGDSAFATSWSSKIPSPAAGRRDGLGHGPDRRRPPERVVVETDAATPAYLVLADTFDPGWSATVDGQPAPIRPAYVAFRAVYLPQGTHTVVFTYRPAGFELGLALTGCGVVLGSCLLVLAAGRSCSLAAEHAVLSWPLALADLVVRGPGGDRAGLGGGHRPERSAATSCRWKNSVHQPHLGSGARGDERPTGCDVDESVIPIGAPIDTSVGPWT